MTSSQLYLILIPLIALCPVVFGLYLWGMMKVYSDLGHGEEWRIEK